MKIPIRTLALLLALPATLACGGGGSGVASREAEDVSYVDAPASPGGGFSAGADGSAQAPPAPMPSPSRPGADTSSGASTPAPQMIIRNGTAGVRVDDIEPAMERVAAMARRLGGYVANTTRTTGPEQNKHARMELKIPSARFDQALSGLEPVGKLEQQTTTTEDVGEQYVDVTARMATARRLEARLLTLLETRTGRLEDVLAVERELARVRGEIEQAEGRLRYLRTRVAMSTLTVDLYEGGFSGANPVARSFGESWRNFVNFVAGFIAALGWLIPLLIVLAVLWRVVRWLFRRRSPGGWRWRRTSPPAPGSAPPPPPPPPPPTTTPTTPTTGV